MQRMWPDLMQFLTVTSLWMIPVVLSLEIPESQMDETLSDVDYYNLVKLANDDDDRPPSLNIPDVFNNAYARNTLMQVGLTRVYDAFRQKKSKFPNHHERRVIVGGICCNGKRQDPKMRATVIRRTILMKLLQKLRKVTEAQEEMYDHMEWKSHLVN